MIVSEVTLVELGILTKEKIRNHPLKMTNLQVVLKIYAVKTYQPFSFRIKGLKGIPSDYYLTDYGLQYVYDFFKDKSLDYARSLFGQLFVRATQDDLQHLDTYPYFNNFRGTTGCRAKLGTKQPALLIHTVGRTQRKYEFDTLAEARANVTILLSKYPAEQFKLYRIRTNKKGYTFKEEVKLIVENKVSYFATHKEFNKT